MCHQFSLEIGSLADWVSGIATLLATIVALGSYFWSDTQRKMEANQNKQGSAYQIGFKLATLISEAHSSHRSLFTGGMTYEDSLMLSDPFQIVGTQQPIVGFNTSLVRDLTDAEQNLLMSLREESFLMDMSETLARNATIREGMAEYKAIREAITAMLPPPDITSGNVASFNLTPEKRAEFWHFVVPAASLLQSIRGLSAENMKMLRAMGPKFHPMMQKHYPQLHIHKIEQVAEELK